MSKTYILGMVATAFMIGLFFGTVFINEETRHFSAILASRTLTDIPDPLHWANRRDLTPRRLWSMVKLISGPSCSSTIEAKPPELAGSYANGARIRQKGIKNMNYHVGDLIYHGNAILRITRVDEDLAWFLGQPLDAPYSFSLGWMRQSVNWLLLRRKGQLVSREAQAIYQQALRQFPDAPWNRTPHAHCPRAIAFLERRAEYALNQERAHAPPDHTAS